MTDWTQYDGLTKLVVMDVDDIQREQSDNARKEELLMAEAEFPSELHGFDANEDADAGSDTPEPLDSQFNGKLIEAVEKGLKDEVKSLLQKGADPRARKLVGVRVYDRDNLGSEADSMEGWDEPSDPDWEDFQLCESALALAVIHGYADILSVLLEKAAQINEGALLREVSWHIPHTWDPVLFDIKDVWYTEVLFPDLLALALGCNGSYDLEPPYEAVTDEDDAYDLQIHDGRIRINRPGGRVVIKKSCDDYDHYDDDPGYEVHDIKKDLVVNQDVILLLLNQPVIKAGVNSMHITAANAMAPEISKLFPTSASTLEDDPQTAEAPWEIPPSMVIGLEYLGGGGAGNVFKAKYKGTDVVQKS
ncbi:hypothetical protein HDU93_004556 [Gonapodya sp. JEL0774]|nr:hypothetical protein HDU93_004556 [Gonapodya sp. JEL0774]